MSLIPGLTPELDTAVRNELRPGEELWYAGLPSPKHSARKMWPVAIFGLFLGGFATFWIAGAAASIWIGSNSAQTPGALMLFPLFGLPFLAIGIGLVSSPYWISRRARRTACCVTSHRAMQLRCGSSIRVQSWSPRDLGEISKSLHSDGTGNLTFGATLVRGSEARIRSLPLAFYGISDPRACEEALLALKATDLANANPTATE